MAKNGEETKLETPKNSSKVGLKSQTRQENTTEKQRGLLSSHTQEK